MSAAGASAGPGSGGTFEIYTFQQDSSVRVAHPRGWTVEEHELGVTILEQQAAGSAGIDVLILALQAQMQTAPALAETLIASLRQSTYPDLAVVQQQPHPQAPEVLTLDATFTVDGVPYQGHAWSMANPQTGIGVFATFYAPQARYATFDGSQMLTACLAPLFGYDVPTTAPAAPETVAAPAQAGLAPSSVLPAAEGQIWFLFQQDAKNRMLHTLDPATGQATYQGNYQEKKVVHPARSLDGRYLVLAPASGPHLLCFDLAQQKGSAMELMQTDREAHVSHPSISRDGKLVAVRIKTLQHVGSVNVLDWSSGAYDHTYTAIASWFRIASFDLETQQEHAVYYQDPEAPDVMKTIRGLGPVFSPTADLLVYADAERIYLCDSHSGKQVRALPWPEGFSIEEHSGLAFSPDGATLAYLSRRQRGGVFDGTIIYPIVLVDIQSGAGRSLDLPDTVRPLSTSTGIAGTICLDFSPDGRYIVFTGVARQAGESWAIAEVAELSTEEQPTDLYALDVQTGQCFRLTSNGQSSDPVWKGR